ncbi:MAG: hypothetical protein ACRDT4_22660, partial [Micromonosporaceae bacterium]
EPRSSPAAPLRVDWQQATLPAPPGARGRVAVRDAVKCDGRWYVVGGVFTADGESYPAGWQSTAGGGWSHLRFAPQGYWGRRHIIFSVACRDGQLAMVGAKSGGAHGNPRVSTWYQRADGVLTEVVASFELYGGPYAVNVGRLAAGRNGWLIVGNRTGGAAVWSSADATGFRLVDADPQLASDKKTSTSAVDVGYAAGGWTVVGNAKLTGRVAPVPMAWRSGDGSTWRREPVPHGDAYEDLHRVIGYRDGLLAVGLRESGYGVWRRDPSGWHRGGGFGVLARDGRAAPFVSGLAQVGDGVVAGVSDGARYRLWASGDTTSWRELVAPLQVTVGGEKIVSIAGADGELLVLADDARTGTVWRTGAVPYR